jgi:putative membrane protein
MPGRRQRFFEKISLRPLEVQVTDSKSPDSADDGSEPDPRFTFANERTFLAWSRTALALVVAGLGVVQLLPPFPGVPWGRHVLGVPLIVFGAVVAVAAYSEWVRSQRALRLGQPLPQSIMPRMLTAVITVMAVISGVVVLASALR